MRKWIIPVMLALVLLFGATYCTTPNKTTLYAEARLPINAKAFSRAILTPTNWVQWWPERVATQQPAALPFRGNNYTIVQQKQSSLVIAITNDKDTIITELLAVPVKPDTVQLFWTGAGQAAVPSNNNLQPQGWIKNVNADLEKLLLAMQKFYQQDEKFYGRSIREESVVDSTFISTSATLEGYPSTGAVYGMLDKLKAFAQRNGAQQTGHPMLNISKLSGNNYLTRVAVPVNKKLEGEGDIQYRWMPAGGNILVTEVTGGPFQVEQALAAMEQYIEDHGRLAPAIPFQSLVTDRRQVQDTMKWVSKVYWPVM